MRRQRCIENGRLKLLLCSPFVRSYQYTFPNNQAVTIRIAYSNDSSLIPLVVPMSGSIIRIESVLDLQSSLQFIAVRTRLHQIGIGQSIDASILHGFDAILSENQLGKLFMVYSNQITASLSQFISHNMPKQDLKMKIVSEYKHILNDLCEHHIFLSESFNIQCLRVNAKNNKPAIRVDPMFKVKKINYIQTDANHLFEEDIQLVKKLLDTAFITKTTSYIPNQMPPLKIHLFLDQIICFASFLQQLTIRPFSDIAKQDSFNCMLHKDQFLNKLCEHFKMQGQLHNLPELAAYRQAHIASKLRSDPTRIRQLDQCLQMSCDLQLAQRKMQVSKTNAQSLKKMYYNPLRLFPSKDRHHYFVTQQDLQKAISNTKPTNSFNKCKFHFLKGKQAWLNLQFHRAIAHLQKAKTFAASPKVQSTILFELGRMWNHLGNFDKAEENYLSSLKIRQTQEGEESISCLSVLENLTMLYGKMHHRQKIQQLQNRCQQIKKRYGNKHIRLMPNLIHSLSNSIISYNDHTDSPTKTSKIISKEEMLKIQIQRIPALAKIWQIIKNLLPQKGQKHQPRLLAENPSLFEHGELNQLYCLLRILSSIQTRLPLSADERQRILRTIEQAKNNSLRMYYRLIFLQAQYCQRHEQAAQAVTYLNILLQAQIFPFSQTNAFRKQILILAKKENIKAEIGKIYIDTDWLTKETMYEQLYDSVSFFIEEKNYLQCIANSRKYLQCVMEMKQLLQPNKKIVKLINNSYTATELLAKSYIHIHLFNDGWEQIKAIKSKIDQPSFSALLIFFCIEAFKDREFSYCVEAFELLPIQNLLKQAQPIRKQIWTSVILSLLMQNAQMSQSQQIIAIYKSLGSFHEQIKASNLPMQINEISVRKGSWRILSSEFVSQIIPSNEQYSLQRQLQHVSIDCFQSIVAINIKRQMSSLTKIQLQQMIDFVIDLITRVVTSKGKSSEQIVFLHVLLFQVAFLTNSLQIQVFVLLWASSLPQQIQGVWNNQLCGSKREREVKLDQLLLHLFQLQMNVQSPLKRLWWFQSKRRDLLKLRNSYLKIKECEQILKQETLHFKILYGSYCTIQAGQSTLCRDILDKLLDNQQDQI